MYKRQYILPIYNVIGVTTRGLGGAVVARVGVHPGGGPPILQKFSIMFIIL
jgi:hypothetical protein